MNNIFQLSFCRDALKLFAKADARNWHERNGGNLTYRLTSEEADIAKPLFNNDGRHFTLDIDASEIAGMYFLSTNSGSFIGNINDNPESTLSFIKIDADGKGFTIVHGDGIHRPTSEISSHLSAHIKKKSDGCRVIYHCHPENIIALTFVLPLTPEAFSNVLWRSISECPLVFPKGVGVIDWKVPGSRDIALASLAMFEKYDILVWAHHGIFSAGKDFDDAYSLIDVVEKAARIYLLYSSKEVLQTITKQNILDECDAFGVKINKDLLK